ncbi:MAG: hypothetical protein ACRD22_00300, partial [Terriglobia bacterium]
ANGGGVRSFESGFLGAFAAAEIGGEVAPGSRSGEAIAARTALAAVVGGTVSELAGGSFANGAISAAFQALFNEDLDAAMARAWARYVEREKEEIAAEIYGEKVHGTVKEYEAMASVILNRVNSGERQYVAKGMPITVHNVLHDPGQFGAEGNVPNLHFIRGDVNFFRRLTVMIAVDEVFARGPTTTAMSFIAPPGGGQPTAGDVKALGNVVPANPPAIGEVYLYNNRN